MTKNASPSRQEAIEISRRFRLGLSLSAALDLEPFLARWIPTLGALELRAAVPILQAMLACQSREDWIGLADLLEYELWNAKP